MEGLFWGLKPVIVAIILGAGWKLGRPAVTDRKLLLLGLGGVAVAGLLDRWEVAAMAAGGVIDWLVYQCSDRRAEAAAGDADTKAVVPPEEPEAADERVELRGPGDAAGERRPAVVLFPLGALAVGTGELARLLWLTLWTGSVLFGGGYMLVVLLQPYVVDAYGWLTPQQFLDGIALTQAVPGPIVTLVAFVGYGVAGLPGAALATAGIYIPSFTAVLLVAPHLERWRHVARVKAALKGVNAVVAGAILGVALTLLPPAVPDLWAGLLFGAALVAVFRFGIGALWLVLAGLAAGFLRTLF